jgi:exonuclease VII small subunit
MAIDKIPRIFKILQAMRPYIKSGEMNLENALKYFSEKGIKMTGVARKAVENAFKKVKGSKDEVFDDTVEKLPYDDQGIPFNPRKPQKEYGTSVKSMMDDEQYFNFKEGYFGKIIANNDKAVQ